MSELGPYKDERLLKLRTTRDVHPSALAFPFKELSQVQTLEGTSWSLQRQLHADLGTPAAEVDYRTARGTARPGGGPRRPRRDGTPAAQETWNDATPTPRSATRLG